MGIFDRLKKEKKPVVKEITLEDKVVIFGKLGINNDDYIKGDKKPIGDGAVKVFGYLKNCVKDIKDADKLSITERNMQISKSTIILDCDLEPEISDKVLGLYENKIIFNSSIPDVYSMPIKYMKDLLTL